MAVLLEEHKQKLVEARQTFAVTLGQLDPESMRERLAELEDAMGHPGFWDEAARAQEQSSNARRLASKLETVDGLQKRLDDAAEWLDMAQEMGDEDMAQEARDAVDSIVGDCDTLYLTTLLRGEHDANNAYLAVHAGAGGTEACDWAGMVYRMMTRWAGAHGFNVSTLDLQDGDEAGVKSAEIKIEGDNAYGLLKGEKGVHRLVRISPFDSNARRHTSFCSVDVMPEIADEGAIPINAEDLRVDTYRSSGAGGQHVNKTESAIRITHIPTGIVVACQTQRSQIQNREVAMGMLRARLAELQEREQAQRLAEIQGEQKKIEWGSQIRSYVLQPYQMVNDHRTNEKVADAQGVLDGDLDPFINAFLKWNK